MIALAVPAARWVVCVTRRLRPLQFPPPSRHTHLLKRHGLGKVLFEAIKKHLADAGLMLKEGTIVNASIIAAPSPRKNQKGECDSEMKQSKKGNQWYFGMKLHIGVDDQTGLAHAW